MSARRMPPPPRPPGRAPGTGFVCFVTCPVLAALSLPPLYWSLLSSRESDQGLGQLLRSPRALGPRRPDQGTVLLCGLGSCESQFPRLPCRGWGGSPVSLQTESFRVSLLRVCVSAEGWGWTWLQCSLSVRFAGQHVATATVRVQGSRVSPVLLGASWLTEAGPDLAPPGQGEGLSPGPDRRPRACLSSEHEYGVWPLLTGPEMQPLFLPCGCWVLAAVSHGLHLPWSLCVLGLLSLSRALDCARPRSWGPFAVGKPLSLSRSPTNRGTQLAP